MNKIIGITGIIGSGKTTLINLLKDKLLQFEFVDVDFYRRNLIKENNEILEILNIKNKDELNSIIYNDKEKMNLYKRYLYENLISYLKNIQKPIILEWALLIDDSLDKYCDYIFILDCPKKVIIKRLKYGDLGHDEINKRLILQLPIKEKISLLSNDNYQIINSNKKIDIKKVINKIKEVSDEL